MSRLFAIGDIHGCFDPFYDLVVNAVRLKKTDRLILLGDYIDRGPRSREVIDFIVDLKEKGFDITALTGNHEQMLLASAGSSELMDLWFMNSGMITLESFGISDPSLLDRHYLDFFRSLEFYLDTGPFLFVHAGFNDDMEDPFFDRETMVWVCRAGYRNPLLSGKTIVHGHRPKRLDFVEKLIAERSQVLPIDTGCVYGKESGYGYLSALEVFSMELFSVSCSG